MPEVLLTIAQAAERLQVHHMTIRRWISAGRLPAVRVGVKGLRVRDQDLAAVIRPAESARRPR